MKTEMKDSGIDWIGEIPKHWNISKVSNHYNVQLGKMLQPKKELSDDKLENYLCAANVSKNQLHLDSIKQMWMKQCERDLYSLKKGDLLVVEGGDVASCDILKDDISNLYFQNALHRVRPIGENDNRYLRYVLLVAKDSGHIDLICNKATISHFTKDKFEKLVFLNVPKEEQSRIANFLDKKCAEIDELIALQEQMITQLTTYKQAVITETVTKGLNPNVKMKGSGVEWIGEIPEHWDVAKLNYFVSKVGSGSTPTGGSSIYVSEGIKFLRSQNVHFEGLDLNDVVYISKDIDEGMKGTRVLKGDVLLNITGGSIGRCYYVDDTLGAANVNQHVCIIRPEKLSTVYLKYFLQSNIGQTQVKVLQNGGNREGLSAAAIKSFTIMNLSLSEQQSIANYLDQKCKEIDALISIKKEKIEQLKAYKKSVIYEYVTGKKQVSDN